MFREVFVSCRDSRQTLAAAPLRAIGRGGQPLHVAAMRDGDDHILFGDQILDVEVPTGLHDLGAARVTVAAGHLCQLLLDDAGDPLRASQNLPQILDQCQRFPQVVLDLVALQSGELLQAHLQDRFGLVR